MYKRMGANELEGELCIHNIKELSKVIPIKPNVRVGEILDGLERVGCKPLRAKRVKDTVTIYLRCPCLVKVKLNCNEKRCIYRILPK